MPRPCAELIYPGNFLLVPPSRCTVSMPHSLTSLLFNAVNFPEHLPACFLCFPTSVPSKNAASDQHSELLNNRQGDDIHSLWSASRQHPQSPGNKLPPGGHRPLTYQNVALASEISRQCALDILHQLWQIHPYRISVMVGFDLLRGAFPALRGYSHALIIDEVRLTISTDCLQPHVVRFRYKNPYHQATS